MKVEPLTVGPIVGATSADTVRLWGRGKLEIVDDAPMRCFGVARIRPLDGDFSPPKFFKMNPNFDMTGIVVFTDLSEETTYEYQLGWFFADLEFEDLASLSDHDWSNASGATLATGVRARNRSRSFVFGSCRYLLRLFGGSWFDSRGDKTFRSILRQIDDDGRETHQLLMLGDQIYADDLNFLFPDTTLDEYNQRYRDAFSQPYIRALMSRVPTYMTLDDHEIEDNWPASASPRDWVTKYPAAIHAFQTYQVSHSPLFELAGDRITGVPNHFWYTFSDGCCDFFVSDTRTERYLSEEDEVLEIISDNQMKAIKAWLEDGSGRIKFFLTSVPFFPDLRLANSDKWGGFTRQRTELLEFIRLQKIPRVVFLAGDIHASLNAELTCDDDPDFRVYAITSSAFFWPYPHTRRPFFVTSGPLPTLSTVTYRLTEVEKVLGLDNFTRVTASLHGLTVEVYARKGELLDRTRLNF